MPEGDRYLPKIECSYQSRVGEQEDTSLKKATLNKPSRSNDVVTGGRTLVC